MISIQKIFSLTKKHVKPAAETLSAALEEDPLYIFLFPERSERKEKLMAIYETIVRYGLRYGRVHATSRNFEGVAIWFNTEEMKSSIISYLRCGLFKVVRKLGLKDSKRFLEVADYDEELHEKHLPEPHWYLNTLGVCPDHQRKGYGTLLINEMLKSTKNDNWFYYLETFKEANTFYYQKFGFKIVEKAILPKSDVKIICMIKGNP